MATKEGSRQVTFEIKKHIGIITKYPTGWNKELNIVSWNGGIDKFDIRDWDQDKSYMSRGVTLSFDEAKKLKGILEEFEF